MANLPERDDDTRALAEDDRDRAPSTFAPGGDRELSSRFAPPEDPKDGSAARARRLLAAVPVRILGTVAAILIPLVIIVWVQGLDGNPGTPPTAAGTAGQLVGVPAVERLLAGVPQEGDRLGSADAPVRLIQYADLDCASCANFSDEILPELLDRYIKDGQVQLQVRLVDVAGADDETDAGTVEPEDEVAASAADLGLRSAMGVLDENRLFTFLGILYRNLGVSTDAGEPIRDLQLRVLASTPGLKRPETRRGLAFGRDGNARLREYAASAQRQDVRSLPTFFLARDGVPSQQLNDSDEADLTLDQFTEAIDRALGAG